MLEGSKFVRWQNDKIAETPIGQANIIDKSKIELNSDLPLVGSLLNMAFKKVVTTFAPGLDGSINLIAALKLVTQEREVTVAKDIIYSILGLFPFGKDVDYEYKPLLCGGCRGVEKSRDCHSDEYKENDPYYSLKKIKTDFVKEIADRISQKDKKECLEIIENWLNEEREEDFRNKHKEVLNKLVREFNESRGTQFAQVIQQVK